MNAGGQTIADRLNAARFGLAGHMLAKAVCKATTEEPIGPKKKHLDYLLHCTEEPNVSIPQLANLLLDRLQHPNWIVVYKALVSIHHLMLYGNERFVQYLASANSSFSLNSFLDNKSGMQGYDMSTYIRRYSKYLNQKALSYRVVAFDFCKVKRGKEDGLLRKMSPEKLLKTLPVIQEQMDALLEFDCSPNELTNAVISSCFVLLFRDLIRLFACYNDGIINMLEKYFDMNKKNCRDALDIYRKFLVRMDKVASFLKVAENVGIPKGEIPDLTKAPASLLDALEQHLDQLEGGKKFAGSPSGGMANSGSIQTGLMSLSATEHALNEVDEKEKQRAIQEEQQAMEEIRKRKEDLAKAAAQSSGSFPKPPSAASSPTNGHANGFSIAPPGGQLASASSSKSDFDSLMDLDFAGNAPSTQAASNFDAMTNIMSQYNQPPRGAAPPQGLPFGAAPYSNPFASPTGGFAAPTMQSPAANAYNPFAVPVNGYPASNVNPLAFNGSQMAAQKSASSPMTASSPFDADFGAVFGQPQQQQQTPFGMPPTKAASATNGGQPKLIQHDVNQSLANLANNLNLGSLGAYGVRPQSMPSQGQMGGMGAAGFMAPGGYRQPMTSNPVNNFGGQQQGMNQAASGVWNPFTATSSAGTPGQNSPTRAGVPATNNDPFASLI